MDTVFKSKQTVLNKLKDPSQYYDPIISSNSVIQSNQSSPQKYTESYLKILNYLSEFKTEEQKKNVRNNLSVYDKKTINEINNRVINIRGDLGNKEDASKIATKIMEVL